LETGIPEPQGLSAMVAVVVAEGAHNIAPSATMAVVTAVAEEAPGVAAGARERPVEAAGGRLRFSFMERMQLSATTA
jgi:hypothetical protein